MLWHSIRRLVRNQSKSFCSHLKSLNCENLLVKQNLLVAIRIFELAKKSFFFVKKRFPQWILLNY